ncbi:META domain-containing protein [Hellea sp.]|nr:META domain-containing protein [Hellea sp.]
MSLRYALLPCILLIGGLPACSKSDSPSSADKISAAQLKASTVTGTLSYKERIALTPGYTLTVSLKDVTAASPSAPIIAQTTRKLDREQVPLSFELKLDSGKLDARKRYSMQAILSDKDGKLAWKTDEAHPINPGRASQNLGLLDLVRVAPNSAATLREPTQKDSNYTCDTKAFKTQYSNEAVKITFDNKSYELTQVKAASGAKYERKRGAENMMFWNKGEDAVFEVNDKVYKNCKLVKADKTGGVLKGGEWAVQTIADENVIDKSRVTLRFDSDGKLSGSSGCNSYGTEYTAKDKTLSFKDIVSTQKACTPALMAQEKKFLSVLKNKTNYKFTYDDKLILTSIDGQTIKAMRGSK